MATTILFLLMIKNAVTYTPPARKPSGRKPQRPVKPKPEPLESWGKFEVPHRLGVSTVSWGDTDNGWAENVKKKIRTPEQFGVEDISAAYNILSQKGGIEVWEVAAGGPGGKLLGRCAEVNTQLPSPRVITRCAPSISSQIFPGLLGAVRPGAVSIKSAVENTLDDLGSAYLDLLLTGPASQRRGIGATLGIRLNAGALTSQRGIDDVGIANIAGGGALYTAHRALEKKGLRCVAAAVDFNLVDATPLRDGTLQAAKDLDITLFARSPLCGGLGSGKYTVTNPTGGIYGMATPRWRYRVLAKLAPLHETLARVASQVSARRTDDQREAMQRAGRPADASTAITVTPTQVALHWLIAKGAVPLPAIKNQAHAQEILDCRDWFLTQDEVDLLDEVVTFRVPKRKALRKVGYAR
mmetsp:Transcript_2695/g.3679  ORF Transcript_2695/g.3679 Transcript_2695/m.3679 type:complete len:411 (-) Transcript_2695:3959-5191(-)